MPLLLSITFFRSAGRLSYLAWFITKAKIELANLGCAGGHVQVALGDFLQLGRGTPSHGTMAPSITPLAIASGTAGSGICTGVAPSAASIREFRRVAERIFRPLRSSIVFDALGAREVERRAVIGMHPQRLDARVLVHGVLLHVVPERLAGALAAAREERQLEHFALEEAPRRVGGQGPHDVGHAVARLVEQLGRACRPAASTDRSGT